MATRVVSNTGKHYCSNNSNRPTWWKKYFNTNCNIFPKDILAIGLVLRSELKKWSCHSLSYVKCWTIQLSVYTSQSYKSFILSYGIAQCYLPPDTSECTPTNSSQKNWYSINLPRRDGRLSWSSWLVTYIPRWCTCQQRVTYLRRQKDSCRETCLPRPTRCMLSQTA